MSKISVVIYYWVFIIFVLLLTKLFGYSDDNRTMIAVVGVATIVYIGFMLLVFSRQKTTAQSQKYDANRNNKQKHKKVNKTKH